MPRRWLLVLTDWMDEMIDDDLIIAVTLFIYTGAVYYHLYFHWYYITIIRINLFSPSS